MPTPAAPIIRAWTSPVSTRAVVSSAVLGMDVGFPQQLHHHHIPHCPQSISQAVAACQASHNDSLFSGEVLPFSPQLWLEPHMGVRLFDFSLGGPPGGAVLPMAHGLGLDIQAVHSRQPGDQPQGGEHGRSRRSLTSRLAAFTSAPSDFSANPQRRKEKRRRESSIRVENSTRLLSLSWLVS